MKNFPETVSNILFPVRSSYKSKRNSSQDFNLESFLCIPDRPKTPQKFLSHHSPLKPTQCFRPTTKQKQPQSRLTHLEQENSCLKQELQKFQQLLKAATLKLCKFPVAQDILEDYLQQSLYINFLQQENEKFRLIFEASHEISKHKLILSKLSEKVLRLEKENQKLSEELVKVNRGGHFIVSKYNKFDIEPIIGDIYRACCRMRLSIDELGFVMNPNGLAHLNVTQLIVGFRGVNLEFDTTQVRFLLCCIEGYEVEEIGQSRFIEGVKYLNRGFARFEDMESEFKELNVALAAAGIDKEKMSESYKGKLFSIDAFQEALINDGLGVSENCLKTIFKALFEDNKKEIPANDYVEILFKVIDPISFDEEEEKKLEKEIKMEMKDKWNGLIGKCKKVEQDVGSDISLQDFNRICKELEINFSEKAGVYLRVYFCTQTLKTNRVPYVNFYITYN